MKVDQLRVFMSRDKDRPRVIVAMDTDEGITGWGECYNHGPDKALIPLLDYLLLFLQGKDPRRIAFLIHYLKQQARFPPGALGLAAISAIDHCLWDISAKALNVHFSAAQTNFSILEYRPPHGPGYVFGTGNSESAAAGPAGAHYVKDPYRPVGGYLELRPDRAGWGVDMDEALLGPEDYIHWERKVPVKPDGATGYA